MRPSESRAYERRAFEKLGRARTLWRGFRHLAHRYPTGVTAAILIFIIIALSIVAPAITSDNPKEIDVPNRLARPSGGSWFGTDQVGRDVYSRTVYGARTSLLVGFSVPLIALTAGAIIATITGYYRRVDPVVMRIMDGLMAIPSILVAIALVAVLGPRVRNVIIALSVVESPQVVRVARATVLSLKEQLFVEAARAVGAHPFRILAAHVFPNIVSPLVVMVTFIGTSAILSESYLSFVGAGPPPEIPSWGNVMAGSRDFIHQAM